LSWCVGVDIYNGKQEREGRVFLALINTKGCLPLFNGHTAFIPTLGGFLMYLHWCREIADFLVDPALNKYTSLFDKAFNIYLICIVFNFDNFLLIL